MNGRLLKDRGDTVFITDRKSVLRLTMNFEQVTLFLIFALASVNCYSTIDFMNVGRAAYMGMVLTYVRASIFVASAVFIIGYSIIERRIVVRPFVLNVYLYLLYMTVPTILFYHPKLVSCLATGYAWPLAMVAHFLYAARHEITPFYKKALVVFFLLSCIPAVRMVLTRDVKGTNEGSVYYITSFLPMVLLLCGKKTKWALSFVIIAFALFSLKRGAVLVAGIGLALWYLYSLFLKDNAKKVIGSIVILLILLAIAVLVLRFTDIGNQMLARFSKISEDGGSGRNSIWEETVRAVRASPLVKKLIGHGLLAFPAYRVAWDRPIHAHNSYYEALYDLGWIGMIWMIASVAAALVYLVRRTLRKDAYAGPALAAFVAVAVLSYVSYYFEESGHVVMTACFWGLFQGQRYREADKTPEWPAGEVRCRYIR